MISSSSSSTTKIVKEAISHGAGPTGILAAMAGFFSDFVKPMINLVPFFFIISLAAALLIWFGVIVKGKKKEDLDTVGEIMATKYGMIFGVSVISTAFWLLMIPVFALTPQEGVLASAVPQVGDWQEQMMGRFDKIDAKLDQGFTEVLDKIDSIDKNAGIVSNPKSYNDYYHNAKVYELTGNLIEARKAYEKYFEADLAYIDPWVSYAQLIKSLEGPSSVLEFLGEWRDRYSENPAVQLVYALNKTEREDKLALLENLKARFSDYGPIELALLELYSYKENGVMTLADQKKNQEALEKLKSLAEGDGLSKYYIDKQQLSEKEDFIRSQQNLADSYYSQMVKNPLDFKFEYLGTGAVSLTFVPAELVKKIYYRIDGAGDFIDTGSMGITMAGSSESLPNYSAIESLPVGEHSIEVKYLDSKGQESPAATFDLNIEPIKISFMGYKIQNPETGKAGAYVYYSFYDSADADSIVKYSFDTETYDRTANGMIYLDSLAVGKHTVYFQVKLSSGQTINKQLEVEIN